MFKRSALSLMFKVFGASALLLVSSVGLAQSASRFAGGSCISQGDWVQGAISQSEVVINAIETLRDDPNCKALVNTLNNTQNLKSLTQTAGTEAGGMAGFYSELQSIGTYLNPKMSSADNGNFREIVNYMVFRKSLDAITDVHISRQYDALNPQQKQQVDLTSQKLRSFLDRSSMVANVAVATTKGILSAMPQNAACFNERPNEAGLIFSSLVSSAAALATGGQISNVGELVSSLVTFDRDMHFAKLLRGVELEKYRASMSCLVESTQEAYCSLQDAQDALDFNRGLVKEGDVKMPLENAAGTIETPMQGLLVLLRDAPIVTAWLQRVLFGIDPQLKVEADMKNANWDSVLNFVKSSNTLPSIYRDMRKNYLDSTAGRDNLMKAAAIQKIIEALVNEMAGGMMGGTINFFTNTMASERMPFFLMGQEMPPEYNTRTNPFDNIYLTWTRQQDHGLKDPDLLLETIGERLNMIIDQASTMSSSYFSSRMIVDAQNLIVEGMNGPSVSPYKALLHIRTYLQQLIVKLQGGMAHPAIASNPGNLNAYRAMIPMLNDTIARLDNITDAMVDIANKSTASSMDTKENRRISRKTMDIIYEFANMLTSRDSFIATRLANAVRMDISDTLWRNEHMTERQEQLMKSMGKDIVNRLSQYFTRDPILQRLDVAQAAAIHNANLEAVEGLFARNYWEQLVEINCKLFGGSKCAMDSIGAPGQGMFDSFIDTVTGSFTFKSARNLVGFLKSPSEDSAAMYNQRARLCVQTLGFPKFYKRFTPLCKGANIMSEFSDEQDSKGLNLSYDDMLVKMETIKTKQGAGFISQSRSAGVCAFRSYIRKNNVYRMYKEIQQ